MCVKVSTIYKSYNTTALIPDHDMLHLPAMFASHAHHAQLTELYCVLSGKNCTHIKLSSIVC